MIFNYDPGRFREDLSQNGYAHLKGLLSDGFVADLETFLARSLAAGDGESQDWKITGKKRQFVFDFPSDAAAREFRDGMARLTGIDPGGLTISERHLKLYDDKAAPYPAPHKDRSASHYSIGLPVRLTPGSSVCLFPDLDPGPNREARAVFLGDRAAPDTEKFYRDPGAVMLNEGVGDLVVFLGSALYHERVNAAGTAVLYIKVNGDGDDPLGENIFAGMAEPA